METEAGSLQNGVSGGLPKGSQCLELPVLSGQMAAGDYIAIIVCVLLPWVSFGFSALEGTQVSKGVERQETPQDLCLGALASTNLPSLFFSQSQLTQLTIPGPRPVAPAPNPPPIGE